MTSTQTLLRLVLVRLCIVPGIVLACAAGGAVGAEAPEVIEVWPGEPPEECASAGIGPERTRLSPKLGRK